jgi:glycosyltransferase involved in cell wall biosynthesis
MNRAKIVISVTKVLENSIKSYNIGHDFAVIPNTVNTHIFPNDSQRDKNCGIKKLLFVGRLTPTKGLPYLIDAINRLGKKRSDFILDIVGDGEYRVDYERMVKEMDLERLIRFHRFMPHEKVISFMQRCDIYIQPSLYETFGVTFIEAMACGKPIIATETGGIPEIVNELTGILIPPGDITAIENAIEYMLDNYRNFSSKEISEYARDRFGYEAFSEKLNNVYDHVLNRYDNP